MRTFRAFLSSALLATSIFGGDATLAAGNASIADLQAEIAELKRQLTALKSRVASDTIPNVRRYVTVDLSDPDRPTIRVKGANLQIVNGKGNTNSFNGLGNVIIGYDEPRPSKLAPKPECSYGYAITETACIEAGGIWAVDHKSGSHNLVIGPFQNYSQHSGLVAGNGNSITAPAASVTAGNGNRAIQVFSSISGGTQNTAVGYAGSVTGGNQNQATGEYSSVSGGTENQASGSVSSISAGKKNLASGPGSSVSGGGYNEASGGLATVSGSTFWEEAQNDGWAPGILRQ